MKKSITIAVTVLCFIANTYAQKNYFKGLHIGAGTALNCVSILNQNTYGGREYEYAPKFGMMYQLSMGYEFVNHLGFQIEIASSSQGQNYEDIVNGQKVNRQVNLSYIQIPILFKYAGSGTKSRFYSFAGIQYGILTGSSIYHNSNLLNPTDINKNSNGFFVKNDLGFKMGLGNDIMLSKDFYLSVGVQGYYGFKDINSNEFRLDYKDRPYEKSVNAYGGVEVGIHYFIR